MQTTIQSFGAECRRILKDDAGAGGLENVRKLLEEKLLTNQNVIDAYLSSDEAPNRNVLYEDPELGFCVVAHNYQGAKHSKPHDHGTSWAIYGQVKGTTLMTEYKLVEKPTDGAPGKVATVQRYVLKPGMAVAYGIGALHSPSRADTTKLIRIEGRNLVGVARDKFECV